jgi:hypothetical protein
MADEQEKIAYLEERISYELVMLNYTFMRLLTSRPSTAEEQLDRNAYLESFGVHARNLVAFLSEKSPGDDRNASDYVPDFEAPDQARLQQVLFRLEKQILARRLFAPLPRKRSSLSTMRVSFTPGSCRRSSRFQGQLGPSYPPRLIVALLVRILRGPRPTPEPRAVA